CARGMNTVMMDVW
nr:immunoglobulin heavy chain junction region [Macaca mulatta]MOV49015.1 immunoglobulin heavy chain junction region [Macaca mulatta]MOV49171.1 immunoglobulin heavy chain junction region [Macaca mulatta]MOV49232.1 immunoglobulin heavy chain junction region [Macaca mulatta]MOV49875.1 immunoglobulin heavy chain junction region [Macaca mulatta]